jgi:GTP-binding protein
MFIDEIEIKVKAGNGGRGVISFRREKYVPKGGPDGGSGGKGGDVYLVATENQSSLEQFRFHKFFKAEDGLSGEGNNKTGRSGSDLYIYVPRGTLVYEKVGDKLNFIADLSYNGAFSLIAKGGRGGRGNAFFATSTSQAPRIAESGEEGEEKTLYLELKLIADVGIVGLPNAGKSTLLSKISNAKPKIGDYAFTTLYPFVGTVNYSISEHFTVADLPGIIEGAGCGKGLGFKFLRHIERCKMLLFLLDLSVAKEDLEYSLNTLFSELKNYNKELLNKKALICGNKIDLNEAKGNIEFAKTLFEKTKLRYFFISGESREGISELLQYLANELKTITSPSPFIKERETLYTLGVEKVSLEKISESTFKIYCKPLERIVNATDLSYSNSKKYLLKLFKKYNIDELLRLNNVSEGDIVEIGEKRFEWL